MLGRALLLHTLFLPQDDAPALARRAAAWVEAHPEQVFDVFRGEEHVARVTLATEVRMQGETRYLELVHARRGPHDAEHAAREVVWLRQDDGLSPFVVRLFEATERAAQLAHVGVEGGKLTGTVHGKGLVRNVPGPVSNRATLLLRAALLSREEGSSQRVTRLGFGRRGAEVAVDEQLVFVGFEGQGDARHALVEHRSERGRTQATYRFDGAGALVGYETRGKEAERWVPYVPPEDD